MSAGRKTLDPQNNCLTIDRSEEEEDLDDRY